MARPRLSSFRSSSSLLVLAFVLGGASPALAKDRPQPAKTATATEKAEASAKEVTLEGDMMCARCSLHETKSCQSVLKVKEVKYYFTDNAVARENVEKVCGGGSRHAIVTGTVSESEGKKHLAPTSVKFP